MYAQCDTALIASCSASLTSALAQCILDLGVAPESCAMVTCVQGKIGNGDNCKDCVCDLVETTYGKCEECPSSAGIACSPQIFSYVLFLIVAIKMKEFIS